MRFLALALVTKLPEAALQPLKILTATTPLMLLLPVRALPAIPVAAMSAPIVTGFLSFVLVAPHETPDAPSTTTVFFVGFARLLPLEQVTV